MWRTPPTARPHLIVWQSGVEATRVIRELSSDLTLKNFRRSFEAICTSLTQSQIKNRQLVTQVWADGAGRAQWPGGTPAGALPSAASRPRCGGDGRARSLRTHLMTAHGVCVRPPERRPLSTMQSRKLSQRLIRYCAYSSSARGQLA